MRVLASSQVYVAHLLACGFYGVGSAVYYDGGERGRGNAGEEARE